MTKRLTLVGFLDNSGTDSGFKTPVFKNSNGYCIQSLSSINRVNTFISIDINKQHFKKNSDRLGNIEVLISVKPYYYYKHFNDFFVGFKENIIRQIKNSNNTIAEFSILSKIEFSLFSGNKSLYWSNINLIEEGSIKRNFQSSAIKSGLVINNSTSKSLDTDKKMWLNLENVLIIEALDSTGLGLSMFLRQQLDIANVTLCYDINGAEAKFKDALENGNPFQLVIISPEEYNYNNNMASIEYIKSMKTLHEELKVIIFTKSDSPISANLMFEKANINGYVIKGRESLMHMIDCVKEVMDGKYYISPEINFLKSKEVFAIDEYDVKLIRQLSLGLTREEISSSFRKSKIVPYSLSSIEKRLNLLRELFGAKNSIQMVSKAKDMGLF